MSGLSGYQEWPSVASVELTAPMGDVVLTPVPSRADLFAVIDGVTYNKRNGIITIPSAALADALSRRLVIYAGNSRGQYGGTIIFLPEDESEPFASVGGIDNNGTINSRTEYRNTGMIDVSFVQDIAVKVYVDSTSMCAVYAYDGDYRPVRMLVESNKGDFTRHIRPDGSYRYVVAANLTASQDSPSMILHRVQAD